MKMPCSAIPFLLLSLLFAGTAGAAPTMQLVWAATSGSGAIGSDTIVAKTGDFLVLDMYLLADCEGIFAASASLVWDPNVLIGLQAE